ncbi:attractin-like protein 1 isoform X1 [Littorina saxatilis]|uniref:attractin-like protein 1 isoform X1 n=1 Tax=Littorina saxatilis TaxID=31220 RepID=UPI0038B55500
MADAFLSVEKQGFLSRISRQKCAVFALIFVVCVNISLVDSLSQCDIKNKVCGEGLCVNNTCVCFPGWAGVLCEYCSGRISLDSDEGIIHDGRATYNKDLMCSWLLDTHRDTGNVSVRFTFNEFMTECGWDHFYIHDGDSVFAPVLAAYSGLLLSKDDTNTSMEYNARFSGRYGFLHFYSDAAYTMDGFRIAYSVGGCYRNCSEHGACVKGECQCEPGWSGEGCEVDLNLCQNNCSDSGRCSNGVCVCDPGSKGEDCSLTESDILWERISTSNTPSGRASHVALLFQDQMWVVGGYSLSNKAQNKLLMHNLKSGVWTEVRENGGATDHPWPLYAHSAVSFQNQLYVYGGVRNGQVTDELRVFNISSGTWTKVLSSGYPVSGHTAHIVDGKMMVFFGYSPVYGYLNHVQEYDFGTGDWSRVETTGSNVQGGYGHASALDDINRKVYINSGYHSRSDKESSSYLLTDVLYVYDINGREWMILQSSGHPRYLHSMLLVDNYLLVFGGNTHNDTSKSLGAKCFSTDFMLYDIKCNSWHAMKPPSLDNTARFGHSMVLYNKSMYMFGGFDSLMLNDLVRVTLGKCDSITNETDCGQALPGKRCLWDQGTCSARQSTALAADVCDGGDESMCPGYNTCTSCADSGCTWCGQECTAANCTSDKVINNSSECGAGSFCEYYHTCQSCQDDTRCLWNQAKKCELRTGGAANVTANKTELQAVCQKPCSVYSNCSSCTQKECMWCSNLALCINTKAYVASFPYGQCMDWTTKGEKCSATECAGRKSCKDCLTNSKCGWCNGLENNGLGQCMDGGMTGPIQRPGTTTVAPPSAGQPATQPQCPLDRWFFTDCPLCDCNGHSTCPANSSLCETCAFPTQGDRCEYCQHFYYGNPVNGDNCSECQCHGQADFCNHRTGHCYCHTRGIVGPNCDKCDDQHKYYGNPKNGSTCYYGLSTDYQYTFNLSKAEDINYTQINFFSTPQSGDRDVDFTLNCSGYAIFNITFKSKNSAEEQVITSNYECDYFRTKFEHKDYPFGGDTNSTFFVYVFAFKTPFLLQISFSQFPKIDLVHFFITFFSCFLSLLLIAAALWKIKHKYDSYRRRQQLMVEMQAMASRPFASVCMEVEKKPDPTAGSGAPEKKELKDHVDTALRRRKKLANKPSAIAIEPTVNNKAAILTLLIQLPFGDSDYAPSGQSGMAVGSALVSIGTSTRKQSLEHIKGDKPKSRKHLVYTHPEAVA